MVMDEPLDFEKEEEEEEDPSPRPAKRYGDPPARRLCFFPSWSPVITSLYSLSIQEEGHRLG
jgi:hypothetical protein